MIKTLCSTLMPYQAILRSGNIITSQNFCFYGKNSIQQGRECSATRHRPTGRLMAGNDDLLCANVSDDDDDDDDDDDMCALVCLL